MLDLGDPVRIHNLACNMNRLSGLAVSHGFRSDGDNEVRTMGLSPGEKLYEELLIGNDPQTTAHCVL